MGKEDAKELNDIQFNFSDGTHFVLTKEYLKNTKSGIKFELQRILGQIFKEIKIL